MGNKKIAELDKIKEIAGKIYDALKPCKVYLFGSFAKGTQNINSDYDLCVVVDDKVDHPFIAACSAYDAIGADISREVDIVVLRNSNFQRRKLFPSSVEYDVFSQGVLMYE